MLLTPKQELSINCCRPRTQETQLNDINSLSLYQGPLLFVLTLLLSVIPSLSSMVQPQPLISDLDSLSSVLVIHYSKFWVIKL